MAEQRRSRGRRPALTGVVLASILVRFSSAAVAADAIDPGSPRLAALARDLAAGRSEAIAAFWKEMQGHAPLVESDPGTERHRRVTFIWRGDGKTSRVTMLGGLPSANIIKPLARLSGTDLWYLTESHATEARFGYVFQINGPETLPMESKAINRAMSENRPRLDPLNTREYAGWSYVELPDAPAQPWIIKDPNVGAGRQTKDKFRSQILDAEYSLKIYTPAGYDSDRRRAWLMIAFDGGFQGMEVTLDNLLAAGKIPPVVVVGVQNISGQTRTRDLGGSDRFARFLSTELVPWARKAYRVHRDARHTIVGGISLGGKMAVYCGLKHSGTFGKVLAQSGSFLVAAGEDSPNPVWNGETPHLLAQEFLESPRLPLEFYLEVGRYETTLPFSPLLETRRLRDVLQAKGYPVTYSEYTGGHNEVCWRASFADAIMALTTPRPR
jgi:enterochelin esterase-like enzyme